MTLKTDQLIQIEVHGIGVNGEGVGRHEGYTVFIEGALPGETIEARFIQKEKRYGRAELVAIKKPSPDRVSPPCELFGRCGGCQLMHLSYAKQLQIKQHKVIDALARIGKIQDIQVEPCIPSPKTLGYRNKIQLPTKQTDQGIVLGLFERSSHRLVEVDTCQIHCAPGETAYQTIRSIIKQSGLQAYHPETGDGTLRHVLIKSALQSGQILVILITNGRPTPLLLEVAEQMMTACPLIQGVVHNQHEGRDNVILGSVYEVLRGSGSITETLCGLQFHISPASFFQVNPLQAEQLYLKTLELAELTGNETVLDAYCGVGTLSLIFARKVKNVIGVESVPEAIQDAKKNGELNEISNVRFVLARTETFIASASSIDIVLLNPPRKGCEPSVLKEIGRIAPKKLIYISCDPATLARDLLHLKTFGYTIDRVQPFDMFPQTAHVECIAVLKQGKICPPHGNPKQALSGL